MPNNKTVLYRTNGFLRYRYLLIGVLTGVFIILLVTTVPKIFSEGNYSLLEYLLLPLTCIIILDYYFLYLRAGIDTVDINSKQFGVIVGIWGKFKGGEMKYYKYAHVKSIETSEKRMISLVGLSKVRIIIMINLKNGGNVSLILNKNSRGILLEQLKEYGISSFNNLQ